MNLINRTPPSVLKYMASSYLDYSDNFNLHCTSKAWKELFYEIITHVGIEWNDFKELMSRNRGRGLEALREITHRLPKLVRLDVVKNYDLTQKFKINKVHKAASRTLLSSSSTSSAPGPVPSVSDNPSMRMPIWTPHDGLLDTSKIPEEGCTEAEAVAKHESSLVSTSAPTQAATTPLNSRMEMPNSNHEEGCVGNSMHVEESDSDAEEGSDMDEPTNPFDGRTQFLQPFQEAVKADDDVLSKLEFGEPGKVDFFTINLELLKLRPDHEHIVNAKFWLEALQQLGYRKNFRGEMNENEQPAFSEFYYLSLIHDGLQALDKAGINPKNVKSLDLEQWTRIILNSRWKDLSDIEIHQLFDMFSENQPERGVLIENYFVACLWMGQPNQPSSRDCPPLKMVLGKFHYLLMMDPLVKQRFKICSREEAIAYCQQIKDLSQKAFLRTGETSLIINDRGVLEFILRQIALTSYYPDNNTVDHEAQFERHLANDGTESLLWATPTVRSKARKRTATPLPRAILYNSMQRTEKERNRN